MSIKIGKLFLGWMLACPKEGNGKGHFDVSSLSVGRVSVTGEILELGGDGRLVGGLSDGAADEVVDTAPAELVDFRTDPAGTSSDFFETLASPALEAAFCIDALLGAGGGGMRAATMRASSSSARR